MNDDDWRRVALDGQDNFRDIGGYRTLDGHTVVRGKIYRSGELNRLATSSWRTIQSLNVHKCIDLRTDKELGNAGRGMTPKGTAVVEIPIGQADDLGDQIRDRFDSGDFGAPEFDVMEAVYRSLARDWSDEFGRLVRVLAECDTAAVFLCKAGKDRTGLGAAIVLSLLGVPWDTVEYDYMLSNRYREAVNRAMFAKLEAALGERAGRPASELDLDWLRGLLYVDREFLRAGWAELEQRHGSAAGFARDCAGFDAADIADFRSMMLR